MLELFKDIKPCLEIVYYISGIFLAGGLILTYIQLRSNNRDAEVRSFLVMVEFLEKVRSDRAVIRTYTKKGEKWEDMERDGKLEHLDNVCRAFDIIGLFDHNKLVSSDLVDRFYAPLLVELWEKIMGSYVDELQKVEKRGKTHYWELKQLYFRVQNVPSKHPGNTGKSDWPKHPRK